MIKILLVDDHELVRTGVRRILQDANDMQVVGEAANGDEALKLAQMFRPNVVLMDLNMPGMNGIEATRRLVKLQPEIKVIALTVLDDDPFPAHLKEAGAQGYLTKGCPASELLGAIRQVHNGLVYVSAQVAIKHSLAEWRGISATPFSQLAPREMELVLLVLDGQDNQQMSDRMNISPKTVSTYRQRVYEKLGVRTEAELTRLAYRFNLIQEAQ